MAKKRLFLVDANRLWVEQLARVLAQNYEIEHFVDGVSCLEAARLNPPDLILTELLLRKIHAIELMQELRSQPATAKIGVIVVTNRALIQDYHSAINHGAVGYVIKPCTPERVEQAVSHYFKGDIKAHMPSTQQILQPFISQQEPYLPQPHQPKSYIKFWGTRGSTSVSGLDYVRYGGETSCVELYHPDAGHIIIDAGTGIRALGEVLEKADHSTPIHLLIGHTHWDHLLGFPFFRPAYCRDATIHIYAPRGFQHDAPTLFSEIFGGDTFPVSLHELPAKLHFHSLDPGQEVVIGPMVVAPHYAMHPGAALWFRIETPAGPIAYVTDNEIFIGYHGKPDLPADHPLLTAYHTLIENLSGCTLLIHEAQYLPEEYLHKVGWGHSCVPNVAMLIKHCRPKLWLATHHDPTHTDAILDQKLLLHRQQMVEANCTDCRCNMAYDGLKLSLDSQEALLAYS